MKWTNKISLQILSFGLSLLGSVQAHSSCTYNAHTLKHEQQMRLQNIHDYVACFKNPFYYTNRVNQNADQWDPRWKKVLLPLSILGDIAFTFTTRPVGLVKNATQYLQKRKEHPLSVIDFYLSLSPQRGGYYDERMVRELYQRIYGTQFNTESDSLMSYENFVTYFKEGDYLEIFCQDNKWLSPDQIIDGFRQGSLPKEIREKSLSKFLAGYISPLKTPRAEGGAPFHSQLQNHALPSLSYLENLPPYVLLPIFSFLRNEDLDKLYPLHPQHFNTPWFVGPLVDQRLQFENISFSPDNFALIEKFSPPQPQRPFSRIVEKIESLGLFKSHQPVFFNDLENDLKNH